MADDTLRDQIAEALRADYDSEHDASHLRIEDFHGQADRLLAVMEAHARQAQAGELRRVADRAESQAPLYGDVYFYVKGLASGLRLRADELDPKEE